MSGLAARRRALSGRPVWRPPLVAILVAVLVWAGVIASVDCIVHGIANGKIW